MSLENGFEIGKDDLILVTGASGFLGSRVVASLSAMGFRRLRCFVRPTSNLRALEQATASGKPTEVELVRGNLLSAGDCRRATEGVALILHLAMQREKTYPGSYLNTVVTTRNLLEAAVREKAVKRFLNVSSFAVYSNWNLKRGQVLDESCEEERELLGRHEVYVYVKAKQDELVREYAQRHHLPVVLVRPGAVYGPGQRELSSRVGIDTFGFFLHLGGRNRIPLTYVDNCAEAIVLAGVTRGIEGEVFNIVDDELPTSRQFLRLYKRNAGSFRSIYIPYRIFYFLCYLWERYSLWSKGQLPPVFNRRRCAAYWKGNRYSNAKLKRLLGWRQRVGYREAAKAWFDWVKAAGKSE